MEVKATTTKDRKERYPQVCGGALLLLDIKDCISRYTIIYNSGINILDFFIYVWYALASYCAKRKRELKWLNKQSNTTKKNEDTANTYVFILFLHITQLLLTFIILDGTL